MTGTMRLAWRDRSPDRHAFVRTGHVGGGQAGGHGRRIPGHEARDHHPRLAGGGRRLGQPGQRLVMPLRALLHRRADGAVPEARRRHRGRPCSTSPAVPGWRCAWPLAMGASVAGIDAAADLVDVASLRTPDADLRVGSMYALPWADESFDAPCRSTASGAVARARWTRRSGCCAPGGLLGISFWGTGPPLDIRNLFRLFAVHAPAAHRGSMVRLNDIATPGVAEEMLSGQRLHVVERGGRTSVIEWPDAADRLAGHLEHRPGRAGAGHQRSGHARARGARGPRAVSRSTRGLPDPQRPAVRGGPQAVIDRRGGGDQGLAAVR